MLPPGVPVAGNSSLRGSMLRGSLVLLLVPCSLALLLRGAVQCAARQHGTARCTPLVLEAPPSESDRYVLVVGSINVDLYRDVGVGSVSMKSLPMPIDISAIRGQTLPASSFITTPSVASQLELVGLECDSDDSAEALVLSMEGPFEQRTGGKGANAAAAAAQTFACELVGNFGAASAEANAGLLADLEV